MEKNFNQLYELKVSLKIKEGNIEKLLDFMEKNVEDYDISDKYKIKSLKKTDLPKLPCKEIYESFAYLKKYN